MYPNGFLDFSGLNFREPFNSDNVASDFMSSMYVYPRQFARCAYRSTSIIIILTISGVMHCAADGILSGFLHFFLAFSHATLDNAMCSSNLALFRYFCTLRFLTGLAGAFLSTLSSAGATASVFIVVPKIFPS